MPLKVFPSVNTETAIPEDYGLKAWTWDPYHAVTTTTTLLNTAGRLNTWTIPVKQGFSCTNIHMRVTTVASAPTSGQCGVALYDSARVLIGSLVTGVHTDFSSTGWKTWALASGPFALAPGIYIVAAWWNGGTAPGFFRNVGQTDTSLNETGNLTRSALANTSITTTAPSNMGTRTQSATIPHWVGLS